MKIAQLTPGSGDNFYCENCLRDAALVRALRDIGHDVLMIPMYLPLQSDKEQKLSNAPIFFGGINVYLQQKLSFFRKTPRWIDRVFDSEKLLDWVGRKADMTSAKDLGLTTISMLRGEHGKQIKELLRLIDWLDCPQNKPDMVCLSNILLAGLVRQIKTTLGVPVICLLQDEDGFLDGLTSPYSEQAWQIIAERSHEIDAFVSVSEYFAEVMKKRLNLDSDKMHVVYTGIPTDKYEPADVRPDIPVIGFLSRMCSQKGLDSLVDAFIILKDNDSLKNAKLRIAGGKNPSDNDFIEMLKTKLDSVDMLGDVEFHGDFDQDSRHDFLRSLTVLSVPEKTPVAYGLYVLEALAAGVPVVEPDFGVFRELIRETGGGALYEPGNVNALAQALEKVLLDADYAHQLGITGREAIVSKFDITQTAAEMTRIYEKVTKNISEDNNA
ncbi:MAG: glycosyltransferase family 4 protein [Planctomycetota bacterium]|jgi:glycosyltransferase involved in cell wall biosynthesis